MSDNETRGIESPDTTALTSKPISNPTEGFDVRFDPTYGAPRKIAFEPAGCGDWLRIDYEWTGCTWRERGFERCDRVGFEVADQIPPTVTRVVLAELFSTALSGSGVSDLDVLNALAREAFDDETVAEAKHRVRRNRGEA
ncbi:hypothetical protein [Natrinema ejinorense]|uniref:Uncharacterized protein n=1 Tax=Natrinema ejinorense TaxID=373386 RepID=A0A2A5QRN9_9EURY|nr:hypothetical protein [Natrinema ejinorense]PCR89465.1 hypothetical protein CP557_02280 [Natrinema ejinorense]